MTDAMQVKEALLPCPFCGHEASHGGFAAWRLVGCSQCGAMTKTTTTESEAALTWNTRAPSPAALDPTWRDNLYADGKTPDKKSIDEAASQYRNQHLKEASMGDMPTITTTPAVLDPVTVEAMRALIVEHCHVNMKWPATAQIADHHVEPFVSAIRALIGQPRDAEAVGERLKIAFELEEFAKRGASYEANKTMRKAAELLRASPSNPQGEPKP